MAGVASHSKIQGQTDDDFQQDDFGSVLDDDSFNDDDLASPVDSQDDGELLAIQPEQKEKVSKQRRNDSNDVSTTSDSICDSMFLSDENTPRPSNTDGKTPGISAEVSQEAQKKSGKIDFL